MFKQYALICLFGMQDVNASVDIFNDMKMLKMNEVSSSGRGESVRFTWMKVDGPKPQNCQSTLYENCDLYL